jgi:hypothetical protein
MLLAVIGASTVVAQSNQIFFPGDLVVSRSTYTGVAGTVPFPGLLPNNAASVANGTFPSVFNNETPDASFGVTSPILVDTFTTTGSSISLIGTTNLTNLASTQLGQNVSTSFPSKSELGLSLTADGSGVTFMCYGAAANQLDVSNANTPGHVDITDLVNGRSVLIYQRDVVELSYNSAVQVTTTNCYSGNNGRNVVLGSNGNYYIVGNAGNNGKSVTFASGTVTLANGSPNVTLSGASTTANMFVGTPFSGTRIPTAAYVTAIADATHFTISAAATGTASGSYVANEGAYQLTGVSFSNASNVITVADTSKLVPGMPLSGTGFAAGSYIQSVSDVTHFIASATPTSTPAAVSYTAAVSNSMLSDNTGVQMIPKGHSDTAGTGTGILDAMNSSMVVGKVNGTYGTTPGYQRGFSVAQTNPLTGTPYAAADKSGKDDNFRGLTNYNNAIYVSKGSGGNGLDGVFQVNPLGGPYVPPGSSAGLATGANAGTASINLLPGWPANSLGANEGVAGTTVYHPFGIWFANDTTLYVGDEGLTGSSGSNAAPGGLEKWTWNASNSQWQLLYTLPASSIPGYTVNGSNLQAEGLRNIAGVNNDDGTVTIYAITSTTGQTLNDEGADPNQLVSITDNLAATTLPAESFNVLETAAYEDVLRGVAIVPGPILQSVASRLTHGSTGTFDLPLSASSRVVEPRSDGSGNYAIVFNFNEPISSGNASVTSGIGSVSGVTFSGNSMIVGLSGVTDQQTVMLSASNVLGAGSQTPASVSVQVGFLYGDVTGDGAVNVGDTIAVRSNSGVALSNDTCHYDVNVDGAVNIGDTAVVRSHSGDFLPAAPAPAPKQSAPPTGDRARGGKLLPEPGANDRN